MKQESASRLNVVIVALIGAIALTFMLARSIGAAAPDTAGVAAAPDPAGDAICLGCHENTSMTVTTTRGEKISLSVDKAALDASVHGKQISCTGCHSDIKGFPHPARTIADRRSFAIESYTLCQQCHSIVYQKALDSVHSDILKSSNQNAPMCTDC
ncbi:MAG: hypothetical protein Q7O66_09355, partial [Dehalococcoidia bacterium]|nr:hypothetical protein [Dehalococcoidia bacterium]